MVRLIHASGDPRPQDRDAVDPKTSQGPITHPVHPPPWIAQPQDDGVDDFAPLSTSHGFESSATSGQLTNLLAGGSPQVQVMKAVRAIKEDGEVRAIIHDIGLEALLLIIPGAEISGLERLTVVLPIPYRTDKVEVRLLCTVTQVVPLSEHGATGYRLRILSVEQETVPGLYKRYVKYLFEQGLFKQG